MFQKRSVFGYSELLSDDEARDRAADLVDRTRKNLQYLKEQCGSNGTTIMKRWKKKTTEKRKALLLEVDPNMYPNQVDIPHNYNLTRYLFSCLDYVSKADYGSSGLIFDLRTNLLRPQSR